MRTLTVNFKIVTSAPSDENLSEVVAAVLKQMAEHPDIAAVSFVNGSEFEFEIKRREFFSEAEQVFKAKVTASYENRYS